MVFANENLLISGEQCLLAFIPDISVTVDFSKVGRPCLVQLIVEAVVLVFFVIRDEQLVSSEVIHVTKLLVHFALLLDHTTNSVAHSLVFRETVWSEH